MDEGGPVFRGELVELGELGEPFAEQVGGGVEGAPGGAVDEQVVGGDAEGFGELDDDVDGGADLADWLRSRRRPANG